MSSTGVSFGSPGIFEGARARWGDPLPDAAVERLASEHTVSVEMGFSS